jgi:hypothetical protein
MKSNERINSWLIFVVFAVMITFLQGCISVQIPSSSGKPKIIGFGYAKSIGGTRGQVYQIIAPGLSLRVCSAVPGISFGWHETRLFYPAASGNTDCSSPPVAVQTKCFGVDFGVSYFMAGFEDIFAVPLPNKGKPALQMIVYSENDPTNTIIERKEIR